MVIQVEVAHLLGNDNLTQLVWAAGLALLQLDALEALLVEVESPSLRKQHHIVLCLLEYLVHVVALVLTLQMPYELVPKLGCDSALSLLIVHKVHENEILQMQRFDGGHVLLEAVLARHLNLWLRAHVWRLRKSNWHLATQHVLDLQLPLSVRFYLRKHLAQQLIGGVSSLVHTSVEEALTLILLRPPAHEVVLDESQHAVVCTARP